MGKILRKYYDYIINIRGAEGKSELGKLTKISSIVAPMEPDSLENITKFKEAIKTITGQTPPDF